MSVATTARRTGDCCRGRFRTRGNRSSSSARRPLAWNGGISDKRIAALPAAGNDAIVATEQAAEDSNGQGYVSIRWAGTDHGAAGRGNRQAGAGGR